MVYSDNERHGTNAAKAMTDRGFGNVYLLNGGIQQFYIDYPKLVEGDQIPDYNEYKWYVETSISPSKKK